jgi:carbon-monoxide dehydrogenase medium subunit
VLLPRFDYHDPDSVEAACEVLANLGPRAKLLAGGTDLIVNMKRRTVTPEHLVSLSRINELKELDTEKEELKIGACVTAADIDRSGDINRIFPALSRGAGALGSPLIRNLATIGGNLASARPAADTAVPLLAFDARVVLKKSGGERTVPIAAFFKGPGETVMGPDEILTEIILEKPRGQAGSGHCKLGLRKALEIALVNVAVFLTLESDIIKEARVALGSVAPTPILSPKAEGVLKGEKPSDGLFKRAAEAAAWDSRPIDDFRASAEYKRAMVEALTRRALAAAHEEAVKG